MQILIVDDEKELADFLCSSFSLEGIKADTAYDGESGLKAAISKSYDFIILDNVMPKMEGKRMESPLRFSNRGRFGPPAHRRSGSGRTGGDGCPRPRFSRPRHRNQNRTSTRQPSNRCEGSKNKSRLGAHPRRTTNGRP